MLKMQSSFDMGRFVPNNLVLIEVIEPSTEYKGSSGLTLELDLSWEKERHAPIHGKVLRMPSSISVKKVIRKGNGMGLEEVKITDPIIKEGDLVYFDVDTIPNASKWHTDGGYFEQFNEATGKTVKYLLCKYEYLICTLRGSEIIPLNNYIIAKQHEVSTETQFIEKYGNAVVNKESQSPIILLQWEKHRRLFASVIAAADGTDLQAGDTIIHEQEADVYIENSYNITLPDKYIYMKDDDVFCKVVDGYPMPFADKIILAPEPIKDKMGNFIIPESQRKQHGIAIVAEIGSKVESVKVGDKVHFIISGATILDSGEYMVREAEILLTVNDGVICPKL